MSAIKYIPITNISDHSCLLGVASVKKYIQTAKEYGYPALGLCDIGTASGLYDFIMGCEKADITPIPGVTFYLSAVDNVQDTGVFEYKNIELLNIVPPYRGKFTHIKLFAYNNDGLHNLFRLMYESNKEENIIDDYPVIDTSIMERYSDGLICMTGDYFSQTTWLTITDDGERLIKHLNRLKEIYKDNLYIELLPFRNKIGSASYPLERLIKVSKNTGIKCVTSPNTYYINKEDKDAQDIITAEKTHGKTFEVGSYQIGINKRPTMIPASGHFYKPDEIDTNLPEEAYNNTVLIYEQAKGNIKLSYDPSLRIQFPLPEGYTDAIEYFNYLIEKGFNKIRKGTPLEQKSRERLAMEKDVIISNNFANYFLIVEDYISYCRKSGYDVGAGRGSAGGSEVAFLMSIHDTDPLKYDLLFERFLSAGRGAIWEIFFEDGTSIETPVFKQYNGKYVWQLKIGDRIDNKIITKFDILDPGTSPDIDTDFHTDGRYVAMNYVINKYGKDRVANIITFEGFSPKTSVETTARTTTNMFPSAITALVKSIPPTVNSLEEVMPKESDDTYELFQKAKLINGIIKQEGTHACGVIMSQVPLKEVIPTQYVISKTKERQTLTQFEYPACESLGLLKMDFLGLDTVNIIQNGINFIKSRKDFPGRYYIINRVDDYMAEDIQKTYKLFQEANTTCIFQYSSEGVKSFLRELKPDTFEDLYAVTAIYRPGPIGMNAHIEFAKRKANPKLRIPFDKVFLGTSIERVLAPSYGLIIYQETLMNLARECAGFSPHETDKLRKATAKKKRDLLEILQPKLLNGLRETVKREKGIEISDEILNKVWSNIEEFSQYSFNKSHTVSYALDAFQAAYLKANYPVEFFAAAIDQAFKDPDKTKSYIAEMKSSHINILPADVNRSNVSFLPEDGGLRIGLGRIKGISTALVEKIISEREQNGEYKDVYDFILRHKNHLTANNLITLANGECFGSILKKDEHNENIVLKANELVKKSKMEIDTNRAVLIDVGYKNPIYGVSLTSRVQKINSYQRRMNQFELYGYSLSDEGSVYGAFSSSGSKVVKVLSKKKKMSKSGKPYYALEVESEDGAQTMSIFNKDIIAKFEVKNKGEKLSAPYTKKKETKDIFGITQVREESKTMPVDDIFVDNADILVSNAYYSIKSNNQRGSGWVEAFDKIVVDNGERVPFSDIVTIPSDLEAKERVQLYKFFFKNKDINGITLYYKRSNAYSVYKIPFKVKRVVLEHLFKTFRGVNNADTKEETQPW